MTKILEGNITKKPHSKTNYTKKQIEELQKCLPSNENGHRYFMENFGYLIHPTKGKMLYKPFEYQVKLLHNFHNFRFNINMLGRQMGKAVDFRTKLLTPNGFVSMGDIKVGDYVYDERGKPSRVKNKTDVQTGRTCYSVNFTHGESIVADAAHLWEIYDGAIESYLVLTTEEMMDRLQENIELNTTISIDSINPLEFEEKELSTRPSDLGSILSCATNVTNSIPSEYIFTSVTHRLELLNSLLEISGNVEHSRDWTFSHTNKILVKDLRLLLSTLGIKSNLESNDQDGVVSSLRFSISEGNSLQHLKDNSYVVESISEVESVPVYCIEVDSPNHLFLAGESLIPTHNCVSDESKITIRSKSTDEVRDITIGEFFDLMKKGH